MTTTPITVGMLYDFPVPEGNDLQLSMEFAIDRGVRSGLIDRPVEVVAHRTDGLPSGSYRCARAGFDYLVDQDCLIIFGLLASENAIPLTEHVDAVAECPLIHMGGSENALGEYVFALNNGSMAEEPIIICAVMKFDGHQRIAIAHEHSILGQEYLSSARNAARRAGLDIVGEFSIPQLEADKHAVVRDIAAREPDALLHLGFGLGLLSFNEALVTAGWAPPRYTTTAYEFAHFTPEFTQALVGWKGIESYDDRNPIAAAFLREYEAFTGKSVVAAWTPCYGYDVGQVITQALANAFPLTGRGVKEALEGIKMLPSASGAPGTMIRFGRYIRQGWMGSEYLVVRQLVDEGDAGIKNVLHATITGHVADHVTTREP